MNNTMKDKLNDDWIVNFEETDKLYKDFYKDNIYYINVDFIYINKNKYETFFYKNNNSIIKKNTVYELNEKSINSKICIITQNHFLGKWVLVNNFTLDRLGDSNSVFNYLTTLTHNFKNPRWSSFIEYEIIKNIII